MKCVLDFLKLLTFEPTELFNHEATELFNHETYKMILYIRWGKSHKIIN